MAKLKIINARYGETNGVSCGPFGFGVAEIEVEDESGTRFFLSVADIDGLPCFANSPVSTIDLELSMELTDEYATQNNVQSFIPYTDYDSIFGGNLPAEGEADWYPILRCLVYLVLTYDKAEQDEFIAAIIGQYADEIEIPQSERELEYLEEMEEDEDWEDEDEDDL